MTVTLDEYADLRTMPGDGRLFKLLRAFDWSAAGRRFRVPAGFVTDLASIPDAVAWFMQNNDPRILRAALPHDWLYQFCGAPPDSGAIFSRADADMILREGMAVCGAGWFVRWTVWAHARVYGAFSWKPLNAQVRALELRSRIRSCNKP